MSPRRFDTHVPAVTKLGRSTIHSPLPENLDGDIVKATSILERFIKGNNQLDATLIPPKVIANAHGIAVLVILKAGFVWSGRAGSGIVISKLPDGRWSAPSAIAAVGAGFGAQIGASLTDCVFILNNAASVKAFSHGGNLTLGGNMAVAAGPTGRSAEAAGAVMNLAPVYSYSKSKGLFAGLSLEGSVIITRDDANKDMYGRKVSPKELLTGQVPPPIQAEGLYRVLNYRFSSMGTGVSVPHPVQQRTLNRAGTLPMNRNSTQNQPMQSNYATQSRVNPQSTAPPPNFSQQPPSYGAKNNFAPQPFQNNAGSPSTNANAPFDMNHVASLVQNRKAPPPPQKQQASATSTPRIVEALYDFQGERSTDLRFNRGDRISVIRGGGPGEWWSGELNGQRGEFPGNYVAV